MDAFYALAEPRRRNIIEMFARNGVFLVVFGKRARPFWLLLPSLIIIGCSPLLGLNVLGSRQITDSTIMNFVQDESLDYDAQWSAQFANMKDFGYKNIPIAVK